MSNNVATGSRVKVAITDDGCAVSTTTTPTGNVAFNLTNTGTDVNEFEILAVGQSTGDSLFA